MTSADRTTGATVGSFAGLAGRVAVVCGVLSVVFVLLMFWPLAHWAVSDGASSKVEDALFEPARSSPLLIFAVFAVLMYGRRRRIREILVAERGEPAPGLALLALGVGLAAWATYVAEPRVLVLALCPVLLGAAWTAGGRSLARTVLLPACFTLLAFPLPGYLINEIVYPLQIATAHGTYWAYDLVGLDGVIIGVRFHVLGRGFEVIESCAGLRSMLTALMASLVYVDIMGTPARRAFVLVPTSLAIAFVMNLLRVVTIVAIPSQELAEGHDVQGIVAIVATILVLAGLDHALGQGSRRGGAGGSDGTAGSGPRAARVSSRPDRRVGSSVAVACATALGAAAVWTLPVWSAPEGRAYPYIDLPVEFDGWTASNLRVDRLFLGAVDYDSRVYRRYEREGVEVSIFAALDQRLDVSHSLLSRKTDVLHGAVEIASREPIPASAGVPDGDEIQVFGQNGRQLVWTWVQGDDGFGTELARSLLSLDRGPWRRGQDVVVVNVSTPLASTREETREILRDFLGSARPVLAISDRPDAPRAAD